MPEGIIRGHAWDACLDAWVTCSGGYAPGACSGATFGGDAREYFWVLFWGPFWGYDLLGHSWIGKLPTSILKIAY